MKKYKRQKILFPRFPGNELNSMHHYFYIGVLGFYFPYDHGTDPYNDIESYGDCMDYFDMEYFDKVLFKALLRFLKEYAPIKNNEKV